MKELYRDYLRLLGPRRRHAGLLVLLLAVSGLLEALALATLIPMLEPDAVLGSSTPVGDWARQRGLTPGDVVVVGLTSFVVLGLVSSLLKLRVETLVLRLRVHVEAAMRERTTDALSAMSWSAFHAVRIGDVTKAVVAEGQNAAMGLQVLVLGTGAILVSGAFLVVAFVVSPVLTLGTAVFAVVAALGYRRAIRRVDRYSQGLSAAASEIATEAETVFGSLKYVRSTGTVSAARARAQRGYQRYADLFLRTNVTLSFLRAGFESAGLLFVGTVLLTSYLRTGSLSAGALSFLALFYRLAPRLHQAQDQLLQARTHRSWLLTWEARQQTALENPDRPSGARPPRHETSLALADVTVRFPARPAPVLDGVTLVIEHGECLTVVGESGSGKTTLLDLVTGLLEPTAGQVLVDGVPLEDVDREAWQARIGLVMQDTPLYHATIAENIAWGEADVDLERVRQCAEAANAARFVDAMPDGYATLVGERGGRLSGGQRQRLALARALYRRPWVLVLDEATSALDTESEALVLEALAGLKGSVTMLVVTHRLAATVLADRVVVLADGRVRQSGTPSDLLADRDGLFAAMAAAQGLRGAR